MIYETNDSSSRLIHEQTERTGLLRTVTTRVSTLSTGVIRFPLNCWRYICAFLPRQELPNIQLTARALSLNTLEQNIRCREIAASVRHSWNEVMGHLQTYGEAHPNLQLNTALFSSAFDALTGQETSNDHIASLLFDTLLEFMHPDKTNNFSEAETIELRKFKGLLNNLDKLTKTRPEIQDLVGMTISAVSIPLSIKENNGLTYAYIADIKKQVETLLEKHLPRLALCLSDPTRDPIRKFPLVADIIDNYRDAILGYLAENHDPKEVERIFEKINLLGRNVITLRDLHMLDSMTKTVRPVVKEVLKKNRPNLLESRDAKILLNREKNLKLHYYAYLADPFSEPQSNAVHWWRSVQWMFFPFTVAVAVFGIVCTIAKIHDLTAHPTYGPAASPLNLPSCLASICRQPSEYWPVDCNCYCSKMSCIHLIRLLEGYKHYTDSLSGSGSAILGPCVCPQDGSTPPPPIIPPASWWHALYLDYMMEEPNNVALPIMIALCAIAIILSVTILIPRLQGQLRQRNVTSW